VADKTIPAQKVVAAAGETLCTLAGMAGFLECEQVRNANPTITVPTLAGGEEITIPAIVLKEVDKAVEKLHKFTRKGVPNPKVRFVHGSKSLPYESDKTLKHLEISNFPSDGGGLDSTKPFPTDFGYADNGHHDPDTFKIEVVDPGFKSGDEVEVELEALRPRYDAAGAVIGHDNFPNAVAEGRKIKVKCKRIKAGKVVFRSRYLRLIVDETDRKQLSGDPIKADGTAQGLFVSDTADGANGDADKVEILDQKIQVTYTIARCKAAKKCTLVETVDLSPEKQRIALAIHCFLQPGGTPVGGATKPVTEKNLRRRMAKWFRRTYAQAGFSPVLVDPKFQFIDAPGQDTISLADGDGTRAAGNDGSGTISSLTVTLGQKPGATAAEQFADATFTINLAANQTAKVVGDALVGAVPAGFGAEAHENAVAIGRQFASADVTFRRTDGKPVRVKSATTDDTALTISIVTVNVNAVPNDGPAVAGGDADIPHNMVTRRLIRSFVKPAEDRIDCFIIGQWASNSLRGRAWTPDLDLPAKFRATAPLRFAAIMAQTSSSGAVMDGGDNLAYTFPHEAGHILHDAFHVTHTNSSGAVVQANGATQLMRSGTTAVNSIGATRRLCDSYKVKWGRWSKNQSTVGKTTDDAISAVERLKKRGAPMFRPW